MLDFLIVPWLGPGIAHYQLEGEGKREQRGNPNHGGLERGKCLKIPLRTNIEERAQNFGHHQNVGTAGRLAQHVQAIDP